MRRWKAALVLSPLLMVGCAAQSNWVNPSLPKESWSADLAACRRDAEDDLGPSAAMAPGDERSSDPMKLADRTRNAKRFDALVAMCMEGKGYRRAE